MIIAALKESPQETRVAITPEAAKRYLKSGFEVLIEKNAGLAAGFTNQDYEETGAQLATHQSILKKSQILLYVNEPFIEDLKTVATDTLLIAPVEAQPESPLILYCQKHKLNLFSMNLIPRISRAQSMDSLSSQANLAGYKAVLEAVNRFHRVIPMMMTAAGMIQPAKVLILGAGVAGLQAIATAKRLGAVVYAFDVRRAAKEQVESLGAEFIEVKLDEDHETAEGYASETSPKYQALQKELIDHYAQLADILVSTALIPGRQAPLLIHKSTVKKMKPGSIIVDLATSQGGNCELSIPDEIVQEGEVSIIGYTQMARLLPRTASELYANNLVQLIHLLAKKPPEIHYDPEDEIIQKALLCYQGQYPAFQN